MEHTRDEVLGVLAHAALQELRREAEGVCLDALPRRAVVVDPVLEDLLLLRLASRLVPVVGTTRLHTQEALVYLCKYTNISTFAHICVHMQPYSCTNVHKNAHVCATQPPPIIYQRTLPCRLPNQKNFLELSDVA